MSERKRGHGRPPIDVSACDREPIHVPGAIQPHGALIAARLEDLEVMQVSANAEGVVGVPPSKARKRHLEELLGSDGCRIAVDAAREERAAAGAFERIRAGDRDLVLHAHSLEGALIVELEPARQACGERASQSPRLRELLSGLQSAHSVQAIGDVVVREIRAALGFDRVMLYRFDEDGHGSVIAEAARDDVEHYLGLHFPASDIPSQARELYRKTRVRMIPDATRDGVPLVPTDRPDTGGPLDLSLATLRSVSPVHLEYLHNFGVQASISFSVVCRGALWGLITCNHETPRYVPPDVRVDCELVSRLVSLQIAASEDRAARADRESRLQAIATLTGAMEATEEEDPLMGLHQRPRELLELVGAEGAAIYSDERCEVVGRTPSEEEIGALVSWIRKTSPGSIYHCGALPQVYRPAESFKNAATGVLAALLPRPLKSGVFWFRPEVLQQVRWGGNPKKPVEREDTGGRLHPRSSFREWREEVERTALPWTSGEIDAAEAVRQRAVEIDLSRQVARAEDALKSRKDLMAVVSHDLRSPLGVIRVVTQRLEASEAVAAQEGVRGLLDRIGRSATRMESLIGDLVDMSVIEEGRFQISPQPEDPRALLDEAVAAVEPLARARSQSLRAVVRETRSAYADSDRVLQVLSNLIGNAVKYSREGTSIELVAEPAGERVRFSVADSGPGIDPADREVIFEPYRRGTAARAGGGSGLGLYIAKGIVEAHGGTIGAENREEGGASFWFTLPAVPARGGRG